MLRKSLFGGMFAALLAQAAGALGLGPAAQRSMERISGTDRDGVLVIPTAAFRPHYNQAHARRGGPHYNQAHARRGGPHYNQAHARRGGPHYNQAHARRGGTHGSRRTRAHNRAKAARR